MEKKMFDFIENHAGAFFVGSLVSQKVIYINKKAKLLFGVDIETCDFSKIFSSSNQRIEDIMSFMLSSGQATTIYNYYAIKADGTKIVVDLQLGYFDSDKTEVFLDLVPQNDTRLQMALHQVDNSSHAEAILNFDDNLSIVHCNQLFYSEFSSDEHSFQSFYKNKLVNAFLPEVNEKIVAEIFTNLNTNNRYTTKLKIKTVDGYEQWYSLELQRRTLDNSGIDKLMVYMANIEKQVELEHERSILHQYMSIVQETTADILYRVDVKTLDLYYYKDISTEFQSERIIRDYINTFMNGSIIHPDDKNQYLKNLAEFNAGGTPTVPIRYSLGGEPYHWYRITGKNIYDGKGELIEVVGALVNVDSEFAIIKEMSTLNKYFDCLQSISGVSFFIIDIKNKVLIQKGKVAEEIDILGPIHDFPESVYSRVFPEDLEKYKSFTGLSMAGETVDFEVRVKTIHGDYQWYNIISNPILDENGVPVEVVGKMNNINSVKVMQFAFSSLNNYYEAVKEFSNDIIFHIDVKTRTFTQNQINNNMSKYPIVYEDFVNTFTNGGFIHPDDIDEYRKFVEQLFAGENFDYKVRALTKNNKFEWVKIKSKYFYNENGEMVEMFGTIENIQAQVDLEQEANFD